MRSVLLPVDGSKHALAAAWYLIEFVKVHGLIDIHVANIEPEPLQWQTHGLEQEAIQEQLTTRGAMSMQPVIDTFAQANLATPPTPSWRWPMKSDAIPSSWAPADWAVWPHWRSAR